MSREEDIIKALKASASDWHEDGIAGYCDRNSLSNYQKLLKAIESLEKSVQEAK